MVSNKTGTVQWHEHKHQDERRTAGTQRYRTTQEAYQGRVGVRPHPGPCMCAAVNGAHAIRNEERATIYRAGTCHRLITRALDKREGANENENEKEEKEKKRSEET